MEELTKWLLTLDASEITPIGAVLVTCVVSGWLLSSDRIVLGNRYREVIADRDRQREAGDKCAGALETRREETATVRGDLQQVRSELQQMRFERDWYQRLQQEPPK